MASVAINAPKTPVTKGSMGVAQATVPNVCKMPGPPAPFVPTPLPNIGKSAMSPDGYSTSVTIEGNAVAIQGASFGSMGDVASKGLGGGMVSMNCEGPTKFVGPGSFTVKIEGKNVQLLSDLMSNNNGPSGSPPNAMTAVGLSQADAAKIQLIKDELCKEFCKELKKGWSSSHDLEQRLAKDPKWAEMGVSFAPETSTPHVFMGEARTTIPDAALSDSGGNTMQCFDFKGPGDRWRNDQYDRQSRLGKGRAPKEISKKTCGCK
jgi:hypothetical protein